MNYTDEGEFYRPVMVDIQSAAFNGALRINPQLRTLDDLNVVSKSFVMLHRPELVRGNATLTSGVLALNKSAIRFVCELSPPTPRSSTAFASRFTRASIRVRVGEYEIEGFVHLPPGGDPMKRLTQDNHPFISLTTALITGPGIETAAPFVAVSRHHIVMAQETGEDPLVGTAVAAETEA